MAEDEPPKPDPEHLARFRKTMTALVAVPKSEILDALVKKYGNKPMKLDTNRMLKNPAREVIVAF